MKKAALFLLLSTSLLYAENTESIIRIIDADFPEEKMSAPQLFQVQQVQESEGNNAAESAQDTEEATSTAADKASTTEDASGTGIVTTSEKKKAAATRPTKTKKSAVQIAAPLSSDTIMLEGAISLYDSGDYQSAIEKLKSLQSLYPTSRLIDQSNIWLAKSYRQTGKTDQALTAVESVSERSGEFPAALYLSGQIYIDMKDTTSAKQAYFEALSLFPNHTLADDSLLALAKLYLDDSNGEEALKAVVRILKEYPDRETSDDAFYMMGKIFEKDKKLKDIERARMIYRKFLAKAREGDNPAFAHSPLVQRVEQDLRFLEQEYFSVQ